MSEAPVIEIAEEPTRHARGSMELYEKAKSNFGRVMGLLGFEKLRQGQSQAVMNLFSGRDTICFLPTSQGKTALFLIPTLCLDWRTLIFSPLVSLMKDQMDQLLRLGFAAGQVSSGQTDIENRMALASWQSGDLQFLFVAPERLEKEDFHKIMAKTRPNLVVIDEAHVLSQWGHSFLAAYTKIGDFIKAINPGTVLAMTATATPEVEEDIRAILHLEEADKIVYYFERKNLILSSKQFSDEGQVLDTIESVPGATIVYCATKKKCEELYNIFHNRITGGCMVYHGGMDTNERTTNQDEFMRNNIRVMFATNAFGMGINKSDIRGIIHRDLPGSVDACCQEAGRGGRDGKDTWCTMFRDPKSLSIVRWMLDTEYPSRRDITRVYDLICSKADSHGELKMTVEQLSGLFSGGRYDASSGRTVNAAVQLLTGARILSRGKDVESPERIKLIKDHIDTDYQDLMNSVARIGRQDEAGYYEVAMSFLQGQTGYKESKIKRMLKDLDKNGYLLYKTPFRGKTTRLIGDIKMMDFEKLAERYRQAQIKLEAVETFFYTPDAKKHEFLIQYFGYINTK